MMKTKSLTDLFLDELQDAYDAEHRIAKALPKMAKAATDESLVAAFTTHLEETRGQISKLEQVFSLIGEKPRRKTCKATVGILNEGEEIREDFAASPAVNAALIAAAQKVEHYETATYGCLKEWARLLDHADASEILGEILGEEEAANDKLTDIAGSVSNEEALGGDADAEAGAAAPAARKAPAKAKKRSGKKR